MTLCQKIVDRKEKLALVGIDNVDMHMTGCLLKGA